MGLSCGNPTAYGEPPAGRSRGRPGLRRRARCVSRGAGRSAPTGKAIGIDMTPEMIELRRRNADEGSGFANVEFHLATIDRLPLPRRLASIA